MPIISIGNSKGGVSKTTLTLVLGTILAEAGNTVTLIDADPNLPLQDWRDRGGKLPGLEIVSTWPENGEETQIDADNILEVIDAAAERSQFVFIDLEGTANELITWAFTRSDLVLIPLQGSHLDAKEAAKTLRQVQKAEKGTRREIPFALIFTRTSPAIRPKTLKSVMESIDARDLPRFETELLEREAFRAMGSFGQSLFDLDKSDVSGVDAAIANGRTIAKELLDLLRRQAGAGKGRAA